eukprot:4717333-Pyramimonas_sp.AAC.2
MKSEGDEVPGRRRMRREEGGLGFREELELRTCRGGRRGEEAEEEEGEGGGPDVQTINPSVRLPPPLVLLLALAAVARISSTRPGPLSARARASATASFASVRSTSCLGAASGGRSSARMQPRVETNT